ncbi:MAG TPA: ABC transporter substrate-binding protein [Balneolales bacterium]|nr:ABC transporter substrate-binding protein [Balneolales bacterium]
MKKVINVFFPVALLFFVVSCSQKTETVVVKQTPTVAAENQPYTPSDTTNENEQVLNYGELNNIVSLDPLFALNNASQRLITLIYEGLVSYGPNGNIQPALAKSWNVSDDSLTYTFHLRTNDYYQDNECFTSGLGRRVTANDVKQTFQRMCELRVPPEAAHMFMAIHGFDAYFKEHHQIFSKKERTLNDIPGIIVQNDSTLQIELDVKDTHFLQKLASPYAVVYPHEALNFNDKDLAQNPVGSGPFQVDAMQNDSLIVLDKNKNYWKKDAQGKQLPYLDQIRVENIKNETRLYKQFVTGQIQYIPSMGPDMIHTLIDNGKLKPSIQTKYNLQNPGTESIQLNFNPMNRYGITHSEALTFLSDFSFSTFANWLGSSTVNLQYQATGKEVSNKDNLFLKYGKGNKNNNAITFAYTLDPMGLQFTKTISDSLDKDYNVLLVKSPVVSRATSFYVERLQNYYTDDSHPRSSNELLRFSYKRYALSNQDVKNIVLNQFPWWQNLDKVTVSSNENIQ